MEIFTKMRSHKSSIKYKDICFDKLAICKLDNDDCHAATRPWCNYDEIDDRTADRTHQQWSDICLGK